VALLRPDGAQRLIRNAEAECAAEAQQMAGYDAIETLARALDDLATARLASQHRAREERMLEALRAEIGTLIANAVLTRAGQEPVYERAGLVRRLRAEVAENATEGREAVRLVADTARRLPGVEAFARRSGARGGPADRQRRRTQRRQGHRAAAGALAAELRTVAAYERRHRKRTTVLERIAACKRTSPTRAMTADRVVERLREADEDTLARVRDYEGRHRQRDTVLSGIRREVAEE
jgi:hypothetical protein